MNETHVTVVGNTASDIRTSTTQQGTVLARFRVAVAPRRFNRESGQWTQAEASFYTVTCWRALAENVLNSVEKGDPVVVTGRLSVREWERDGRWWMITEIDATSVGHDLSRGTSAFQRIRRAPRVVAAPAATPLPVGTPGEPGEEMAEISTAA